MEGRDNSKILGSLSQYQTQLLFLANYVNNLKLLKNKEKLCC